MIIVRISGGLGNQMFQYAFGRSLAIKHKTDLAFDVSFFSSKENEAQKREFLLNRFNVVGRIATKKDFELLRIPPPSKTDLISKIKRKVIRIFESFQSMDKRKFIIEEGFTFNKKYLNIKNNSYCAGIWQTEKYFLENKNILEKEFTLKSDFSNEAKDFLNDINTSISVSVHIRRGDYVTNPLANKKHGTVGNNYYAKSINYILTLFPEARFFVFSDDLEWVKNNLNLPTESLYVSGKNISNTEELLLMENCQHNILANSSFGWWAAWLNKNPNKVVIVPEKWFRTEINTKDLVTSTWIRI